MGEVSRAARVLTSPGLAPADETTARKLASKHPRRADDTENAYSPNGKGISLSKATFYSNVRHSPRGSCPGPSGWRYDHLRLLLDNPGTADDLYLPARAYQKGYFPLELASCYQQLAFLLSLKDWRTSALLQLVRFYVVSQPKQSAAS